MLWIPIVFQVQLIWIFHLPPSRQEGNVEFVPGQMYEAIPVWADTWGLGANGGWVWRVSDNSWFFRNPAKSPVWCGKYQYPSWYGKYLLNIPGCYRILYIQTVVGLGISASSFRQRGGVFGSMHFWCDFVFGWVLAISIDIEGRKRGQQNWWYIYIYHYILRSIYTSL